MSDWGTKWEKVVNEEPERMAYGSTDWLSRTSRLRVPGGWLVRYQSARTEYQEVLFVSEQPVERKKA